MDHSLRWCAAKRENLEAFTIKKGKLGEYIKNSTEKLGEVSADKISVGLAINDGDQISTAIFVVPNSNYFDTFSWLNTFLPEAFPLSQFARVLSERDAQVLSYTSPSLANNLSEQWASIVLGELLGQGSVENDVLSVRYSRASACFSAAVSRVWMLYDSRATTETAVQRLMTLENDSRFAKRNVTLRDLKLIWEVMGELGNSLLDESPDAVVRLVCRAASDIKTSSRKNTANFSLDDFTGLRSASVEERVVAFQDLTAEINKRSAMQDSSNFAAIIAGAVFLVGKGTSHAFLLKRTPTLASAASAWFGLIAALVGPTSWDSQWQRACRGVQKVISQSFRWEEPVLADISWIEYDWMSAVFNGSKMFESVSRTVAKVLSIEIIPGATCQLRLAGSNDDIEAEHKPIASYSTPTINPEFESSIIQFLELADTIKNKLHVHIPTVSKNLDKQSSFFSNDKVLSSKPPRKKRTPNY